MIFHDIIQPEKFHLGQKCKIPYIPCETTIYEITTDSITATTKDTRAKFNCPGFYYDHHFNGITNPSYAQLREITIKNFILGKIPRLIPL